MEDTWKRVRMYFVARRELPNTANARHAHTVGEMLRTLLSRGYSVERILGAYPPEFRPEALEMMRVAAGVYFPDKLEEIENVIGAQVPADISSL